jgi:hypothetical protein
MLPTEHPAANIASHQPQPRLQTSATEDTFDYQAQAAFLMRSQATTEASILTPPASEPRAALQAIPTPVPHPTHTTTTAPTNRLHSPAYAGASDISDDSSSVEELEILAPSRAGKKHCNK